ncbi:MAG: RNA polymerase sigma factor [Sphingomicrobium sp.]|nr:RNA polymerase sigma factor [Sphingomonadales bacterium]
MDYGRLGDVELAGLFASRDRGAIRHVTTANNQRLFRTAWAILKDRAEAEEAVQSAYLHAFAAIASFEGRSSLSTWLTRIVVNDALGRRRAIRRRRYQLETEGVAVLDAYRETLMQGSQPALPDAAAARTQLRLLLERGIAELPASFRAVFVLRDVEGLSVEETAEALDVPAATVKTRLLRARRKLQELLAPEVHGALSGAFPFAGVDCERLTDRVLTALAST